MRTEAQTWDANAWLAQALVDAVRHQVSDWHLDATPKAWVLRHRIHGQLQIQAELDTQLGLAVMACIKVKAGLDITEHRRPQEGRFPVVCPKGVMQCRVTLCPTYWGEKCAVRFLHGALASHDPSTLGMTQVQQGQFAHALAQPHGMIIVCGPTGSGKSQTLACAMQCLVRQGRHCLSLEDPVEIPIPGVNAIEVHPALGLDYSQGLKSCLRMDPDAIMLGEVRDAASAQLALQAAQTGHLILCTVHSHDLLGIFKRLAVLGVPADELWPQCVLLINQRLLPLKCQRCQGRGCQGQGGVSGSDGQASPVKASCQGGLIGRQGLFECWSIQSGDGDAGQALGQAFAEAKITPLWQLAQALLAKGVCDTKALQAVFGSLN